jgi:hypothetical protein
LVFPCGGGNADGTSNDTELEAGHKTDNGKRTREKETLNLPGFASS